MSALTYPEITFLFAAVFGVLHVVFTLRVGGRRLQQGVSFGDGGDEELLKRMRGHGNFTENVPLGLLLILLNELSGLASGYVIALASAFLLGRVGHYCSVVFPWAGKLRPLGMLFTLLPMLAASVLLVI